MARQPRTPRATGGRAARRSTAVPAFDALIVEGALIAPAQLARVAAHEEDAQNEADYGVPKGLTLRDEIARYFRIGQAHFAELAASDAASPLGRNAICGGAPARRARLRRHSAGRARASTIGDRHSPSRWRRRGAAFRSSWCRRPTTSTGRARSLAADGRRRSAASGAAGLAQRQRRVHCGASACNGERLRLVRDNPSLTRPAYIEADLRRIFEDEAFADFAALWLLIHASRFGPPGAPPSDCALERWREAGQKAGRGRPRPACATASRQALQALGNGFVAHPANGDAARAGCTAGELPLPEFFGQLLRLVYRLIFLLAAEDRDLLHPPDAPAAARTLYAEGYSLGALRDRAVRRSAWDRHHDGWEGLLIIFDGARAAARSALGLPALGGLFARGAIADLESAALVQPQLSWRRSIASPG